MLACEMGIRRKAVYCTSILKLWLHNYEAAFISVLMHGCSHTEIVVVFSLFPTNAILELFKQISAPFTRSHSSKRASVGDSLDLNALTVS